MYDTLDEKAIDEGKRHDLQADSGKRLQQALGAELAQLTERQIGLLNRASSAWVSPDAEVASWANGLEAELVRLGQEREALVGALAWCRKQASR